ncbi:unnamed protein product [Anisakis simplex]|uniref:Uncharacterized protein n=1 Tax=Anisakis simplex TaxID=6269 RepID=A0A3P6TSL7_ANISI|nr:unnamed protein product [Anisakis simplex]
MAVRVLSGIARGFASKFTKYVPMFMTIVFEKFKDKKTSVREALNECVDTVASTSHADCFVASLTEVFEKKSVNPDIKANIDRWIYRTLLHYTQTNPPNDFITNMAPFIAQHICDGDADVRDAACMACAGVMRLIGEKTTSALIKGWVDDKVKQKKVNEYHEKAVAEAEELAKSAGAQGDDQHDDQNNLSGDKVVSRKKKTAFQAHQQH